MSGRQSKMLNTRHTMTAIKVTDTASSILFDDAEVLR
jgi:hypothetical protein